jgi:hypothetical protein
VVVVGEDILPIRSGPPAEAEAEVERGVVVVAAGGETTAIDIAATARIRKGALTIIAAIFTYCFERYYFKSHVVNSENKKQLSELLLKATK